MFFFFFFKQKTAYELRISDWSSDVCSSDLLDALKRALALQNIGCEAVILPPGESQTSYAGFEKLSEALLALKVERRDHLIALGGGVIGDLAGFVASVLRRGMDFIKHPTSLLDQGDSSVDGKTEINSRQSSDMRRAGHEIVSKCRS